ncbi:MAG: flagellar motor protein MotB [Rhodospirillales bacterium]|nr:flagellar motor protein MotB [Alphaproteobacteria bacterium]USO03471.1 MAG: flagellar motor protein MotB [Rhodospirillales bacterium]
MSDKQDELRPIIIKKVKKVAGGHHGGAWKVAYADFVTAMMAFFLLLWLLNVTTKEQKEGIAEYFDPTPMVSKSDDGAGGLLGGLTVSPEGAMISQKEPVPPPSPDVPAVRAGSNPPDTINDPTKIEEEKLRAEIKKREDEEFKKTESAINQAIQGTPDLQDLAKNIMMDITPEGLRIQIVDQDGASMFPSGSAQMYEKTTKLMQKVAKIILGTPNELSIRGHTDGVAYGAGATYTNWELSADRANSSRRVLLDAGVPKSRVNNVLGKADKDHLFSDDPADARNRRISIILLRQELTTQEGANRSNEAVKHKEIKEKRKLYQRSSGSVEFP